MLQNKRILICICSSVAAIELPKLIRELRRRGAIVICVMSEASKNIIHPNIIHWASKNPVITKLTGQCEHILYTDEDKVDLILLAPATSNLMAKIANGICDSSISTIVTAAIGARIPIMAVPCMHLNMYNNLTKINIEKLKKLGIDIIAPKFEENKAKFPNREKIINILEHRFSVKDLLGQKIVVTAGGTREAIDPIRFISNKSSGKMGTAIANEAHMRGAEVTLISGTTIVKPKYGYKNINVTSCDEMWNSIKEHVVKSDTIIHAAAISDFTLDTQNRKISSNPFSLKLIPTKKIIDNIKKINNKVFLVGFKAEYKVTNQELVTKSYTKLQQSHADLIVGNDVSRPNIGFEHDYNECIIVDKSGNTSHLQLAHKKVIANQILDMIP